MQRSRIRRLLDAGLRVVLPDVCAGCGISGAWICDECGKSVLAFDPGEVCQRCGHPAGGGNPSCSRCEDWLAGDFELRSTFAFDGPLRQSVLKMKYHGEYARAAWHAQHLADLFVALGWQADVIVPVPLHHRKHRSRGYNQAEKLAAGMSLILDVPMENLLERVRNTPSQTTLTKDERQANVAGAFRCKDTGAGGRHVILIDDVATTCSTLRECVTALNRSGAAGVRALTVARDV